jgi:AcrR family transcriptional regulator
MISLSSTDLLKSILPEGNISQAGGVGYTFNVTARRDRPANSDDAPGPDRPAAMGRPRAEDRTPAILEAAKQLMGEVGYDRLRIQDVADRAGAGLATLYRRWPTKQALVADAIRYHADALLPPRQDDPKADLLALYRAMTEKMCGEGGEVLSGLVTAFRMEPELAAVVRDHVLAPMRERARADLSRIVGADNPALELLVDLGPGLLVFRTVMLGEVVATDEFLETILDLITALAPSSTPA